MIKIIDMRGGSRPMSPTAGSPRSPQSAKHGEHLRLAKGAPHASAQRCRAVGGEPGSPCRRAACRHAARLAASAVQAAYRASRQRYPRPASHPPHPAAHCTL